MPKSNGFKLISDLGVSKLFEMARTPTGPRQGVLLGNARSYTPLADGDFKFLRRNIPSFDAIGKVAKFQENAQCNGTSQNMLKNSSLFKTKYGLPMTSVQKKCSEMPPDFDKFMRLLKEFGVLKIYGSGISISNSYTDNHAKLVFYMGSKKNVLVIDPDDTRHDTPKSHSLVKHLGKNELHEVSSDNLENYSTKHEIAYIQSIDELLDNWGGTFPDADDPDISPDISGHPTVEAVDWNILSIFFGKG